MVNRPATFRILLELRSVEPQNKAQESLADRPKTLGYWRLAVYNGHDKR